MNKKHYCPECAKKNKKSLMMRVEKVKYYGFVRGHIFISYICSSCSHEIRKAI